MGASSNATCNKCPAGKANPVPGSTAETACIDCLPGSISPTDGFGTCALCEPGKFTSTAGNTACQNCTDGQLCVEGSMSPQPCPFGTHADQAVLDSVGYLSNLATDCIEWCVLVPARACGESKC